METQLTQFKIKDFQEKLNNLKTDLILLFIDSKVNCLYKENLGLSDLNLSGKKIIFYEAPEGESGKYLDQFGKALEFFLEKGIHRKAHLVVIGGGATSDLGGFIASSLLRGISWSVIPTTILSMVDASIGGKTGINSQYGKNLIGAFHLPQHVWIDTDFLETLPQEEFVSGMGEVLKYCFLDKSIFESVEKGSSQDDIIFSCGKYKLDLTQKDFKEQGLRKILNLGHTIGHGIEKVYSIPHGEAVIWGMMAIFSLFERKDLTENLYSLMEKLGLKDLTPPWEKGQLNITEIMDYLKKDKKLVSRGEIDLITIESLGSPKIETYSLEKVEELLKKADL